MPPNADDPDELFDGNVQNAFATVFKTPNPWLICVEFQQEVSVDEILIHYLGSIDWHNHISIMADDVTVFYKTDVNIIPACTADGMTNGPNSYCQRPNEEILAYLEAGVQTCGNTHHAHTQAVGHDRFDCHHAPTTQLCIGDTSASGDHGGDYIDEMGICISKCACDAGWTGNYCESTR